MKSLITMHATQILILLTASLVLSLAGCNRSPEDADFKQHAEESEGQQMTNRVDITPAVRQNLGISFAKVESRRVAQTLRVPGRFELMPNAKREYRAQASGRVELLVAQYAKVEVGTPLYRLDSQRWREMQKELVDAHARVTLSQAAVDSIQPLFEAHEAHHVELQQAVDLWASRVKTMEQLQAAGGARGDEVAQTKASLATARSNLAETLEKEAELVARRKETSAVLDAARSRLSFLFESAAVLTGISAAELQELQPNSGADPTFRWTKIAEIEVRALAPGVIDSVNAVSGGFVDEHAPVVVTVQPELVRFRAVGLQSDLPRLVDGQSASVVVAQQAGASGQQTSLSGTLTLAPSADPERRTVELVLTPSTSTPVAASWVRAGVAAFLEVVTSGSGGDELAIPLRCVARDGTQAIIFRRDPANPDKAIRLEADLGIDDGRWIVIKSGVAEGNEIVLDGVYQLMVATSGSITKGGHFHPDGSFHDGED